MDGEMWLILLIILGVVAGLIVFFVKRGKKTTPPPRPTITTTMKPPTPGVRPPATTAPTAAPVVRYPQNVPQSDPVIPIFEDRMVRQVRRCPSCDGENPIHAQGCQICGRRL